MWPTQPYITQLSTFFESHGWCRSVNARLASGRTCNYYSWWAKSWSLWGATMLLYPGEGTRVCRILHAEIISLDPRFANSSNSIIAWNDVKGRTKQQVIELCKRLDI